MPHCQVVVGLVDSVVPGLTLALQAQLAVASEKRISHRGRCRYNLKLRIDRSAGRATREDSRGPA
jgi:hypothetical protein